MPKKTINQKLDRDIVLNILKPLKTQWKPTTYSKVIQRLYLEWHYYHANYGHLPKKFLEQQGLEKYDQEAKPIDQM